MKKVLVIRFSSIGDIVLTTPVIRAIRKQTHAEIHLLTKTAYADIYRSNPNIFKVHTIDPDKQQTISHLLKEGFDHIVDLQKNLKSYRIKRRLHVQTSSFPKLNRKKWMLVNFKLNRMPKLHIVDRYFEAVKKLGVKNDGQGLEYYIPARDEVSPSEISNQLCQPYIAYAIGGQHFTKIMPPEKIASIVSRLSLPVVLLGSASDKQSAETILKSSTHTKLINQCGRLNLNQSASIIQQAAVVICHDTGLMHIAAAFNKPIVSIWGNTVPELGMYPYMPLNNQAFHIAEVKGLSCRPCSKIGFQKCPKKHFKCMLYQDENQIVSTTNQFISNTQS